jgi:hypothetical protein
MHSDAGTVCRRGNGVNGAALLADNCSRELT